MGIKNRSFGTLSDGREATLFTISNASGMTVEVTDFGATLVSALVPDQKGTMVDVILGYSDVNGYNTYGGFLGATIGRNGNRIGKAQFALNGKVYTLEQNEKGNNLHSGNTGFDKRIWLATADESANAVIFSLHSPDGDEGFPGNFDVKVTYTLTEDNAIRIDYEGISDQDTIANMTNHSYFNLEGHDSGTILDHSMQIFSDGITAVDEECIPTGEIYPVEGTAFDFRQPKKVGLQIDDENEQIKIGGGYDHNYAMNTTGTSLEKFAVVTAPISGITMEVYSDCVGMQFYAGNFMDEAAVGKSGQLYVRRGGLCLETQYYPDAIHHENFASPVLKALDLYRTTTVYKFSAK